MSSEKNTKEQVSVRIAVLVVSDTRTLANDTSGDLLAQRVIGAGHELADRKLLKDDVLDIRAQVQMWIDDPSLMWWYPAAARA